MRDADLTVCTFEHEAAPSKAIARVSGAEAGYIPCGCEASLILATAACLTGFDVERASTACQTPKRCPKEQNNPGHRLLYCGGGVSSLKEAIAWLGGIAFQSSLTWSAQAAGSGFDGPSRAAFLLTAVT